jgi:hypothetical protein
VSQSPAESRVLILRAIDAAVGDRHARLGHAGDWRAEGGGCDFTTHAVAHPSG